jgi:hypothetical protein
MFGVMEFGKGHPAIGVAKGLLIDPSYVFGHAHVGILGFEIVWMLRLNFTHLLAFLLL